MRAGWRSTIRPTAAVSSWRRRCRRIARTSSPDCESKPDMPRLFDLIVFDWDGTLFDSTALIVRCIQAACRDIGCNVPCDADAAYVIGLGLSDALRHAVPGLPPQRYPELGLR